MTECRFFKPWVPEGYEKGINGKKILVIGASYYCNKFECPFFSDCTSKENKDSSKYDYACPYVNNRPLHDEPSYTTSNKIVTYKNFSQIFEPYVPDGYDIWEESVAFTNYLQFYLPSNQKDTIADDITLEDTLAFLQTLKELEPNIVIIWGSPVRNDIHNKLNKFILSNENDDKTGGYICHLKLPETKTTFTLLQLYHPAFPSYTFYFKPNIKDAIKYLGIALNE